MGGGLARCDDGSEQAHLHPMCVIGRCPLNGNLGLSSLAGILKAMGLRLAVRPVNCLEPASVG